MDSNLSNRTFHRLWVLLVTATESQTKSAVQKIRKEISIDSIKEISIDSIKCLVTQTTEVTNNVRNKQDSKAPVTEDTVYKNEEWRWGCTWSCMLLIPALDRQRWVDLYEFKARLIYRKFHGGHSGLYSETLSQNKTTNQRKLKLNIQIPKVHRDHTVPILFRKVHDRKWLQQSNQTQPLLVWMAAWAFTEPP